MVPILSMLIMDVSNSTKAPKEIYDHLAFIEEKLQELNTDQNRIYVNYRMGDELFILSDTEHYTALLSLYVKVLWPASDFPLKCSFHSVDIPFPEGNPEHWNHPSIKTVRESLQSIKKSNMQDFASPHMTKGIEIALMYATDIFRDLTESQQEVMQYYLTGMSQKDIAAKTNKSVATISKHVQLSRVKQLTEIIDYVKSTYSLNSEVLVEQLRDITGSGGK